MDVGVGRCKGRWVVNGWVDGGVGGWVYGWVGVGVGG